MRRNDEKPRVAGRAELGSLGSTGWPAVQDEEAQTRSDLQRLPDDEERLRWTTRTLVELEGDGERLDFDSF